MKALMRLLSCVAWLLLALPGGAQVPAGVRYKVLPAITQNNLAVFPVVADVVFDTSGFITLDEGLRSGEVVITEAGANEWGSPGLVRPPLPPGSGDDGIWSERIPRPNPSVPQPDPQSGARVNELALVNHSGKPLILLAGEIIAGGKQDRIVSRDRIVPAHSGPISLSVFCVEPYRWRETSVQFGAPDFSMAQPALRLKAMVDQSQQGVWDQIAASRMNIPHAIESTSSYAGAMQSDGVKYQLDSMAIPLDRRFEKLRQRLRAQNAIGVVVAIDGELVWADLFASAALLEKYWPKLIRSYAAETLRFRAAPLVYKLPPSGDTALDFIEHFNPTRENVSSEPGLYRNTELDGGDFHAFILTSLLPNTGFNIHMVKMKREVK